MADTVLIAESRSERGSAPARRLRHAGRVPAVVYGLDTDTLSVTVPTRELGHILAGESGANTVITLKIGSDEMMALVRQIQRHPVRGDLLHVDFVRVRADVAVSAGVPLHLTGEPEGVREGGLLEQLLFSLTVEAKPADIPVSIEADVSHLVLNGQLHVRDLRIPSAVALQHEDDELVAQVTVPRGLAEEEEVEGEEVEGEGLEGEGAEGAAAEGAEESGGEGGE